MLASLRPSFYWTKSTGGVGPITYQLETSTDLSFATGVSTQSMLATTSYQPATGIPVSATRPVGAHLYWRVQACASGACSMFSLPRRIELGRPLKDVNGDGKDDLVAGASDVGTTNDPIGTAALFLGKTSLMYSGTPDATIPPTNIEDGGQLGVAVATVDFNGDGFADIVTGSRVLNDHGAVHVFYGGAQPNLAAKPDTFSNPFATPDQTRLGYALGVGDFDGDGYGDILASAPFDSDGDPSSGFVMVYFGRDNSTAGTPTSVQLMGPGTAEGANFGASIVGLGDVDGDGADDFAVGAPVANVVFVFSGDPARKFKSVPTQLTIAGASIGGQVAAPGDVNGDGLADLIVTDTTGKIYVFFGSPTGIQTKPGWTISGASSSPIGSLGDNGGGYAAFTAGLTTIDAFIGSASPPATSTSAQAVGTFAFPLDQIGGNVWTGDLDGDGIPELVTTRNPGGLQMVLYHSSSGQYPAGIQNSFSAFTVALTTKVPLAFN